MRAEETLPHPAGLTEGRRTPVAPALWAAGLVLVCQLGGLVTIPLIRAGLLWPALAATSLAAVVLAIRHGVRWSAPVTSFVVLAGVFAAWIPYALAVAPDRGWASREVTSLAVCAVTAVGALLVGSTARPAAWRLGWLVSLAVTGGIGVWELLTDHHLWVTAARPWRFQGRVAAATYINPNNFGIVLLAMLVAAAAWRAEARSRAARSVATAAVVVAALLALASQSRAAALGLVLLLLLHLWRGGAQGGGRERFRAFLARHPGRLAAVGAAAAAMIVATFLVPGLAARNPVAQMLYAALQPETGASDLLRVRLVVLALGYGRDSHLLGTGAGSFEPLAWNDPHYDLPVKTNLHNTFAEILTQYGVVVAALLAAVALSCLWRAVGRRGETPTRHESVLRTEVLGHLLVFAAAGLTASSCLTDPWWWIVLANACVSAGRLGHSRPWRPRSPERALSPTPAGRVH